MVSLKDVDTVELTLSSESVETVTLCVFRDSEQRYGVPGVWLGFSDGEEPAYKLSLGEAAWLRDRLNTLLGE